jgi:hypothetical protein
VGYITRESVRRALANGISADQASTRFLASLVPHTKRLRAAVQIISYLMTHAHPQMRKNVSASRCCLLYDLSCGLPFWVVGGDNLIKTLLGCWRVVNCVTELIESLVTCDGAGSDPPLGTGTK